MTDETVEVVIPTIKEDVLTLDSIPESIPTHVIRTGTLNQARNIGVGKCDSDIVVIMDDDIKFSSEFFEYLINISEPDKLIGLADREFGLILGRTMVFFKSLWERLGGFNEKLKSHNGDTDFAIRAHKQGYDVVRLPENIVFHKEHERSVTLYDRLWRILYLSIKYPRYAPLLCTGTIHYNVQKALGMSDHVTTPNKYY